MDAFSETNLARRRRFWVRFVSRFFATRFRVVFFTVAVFGQTCPLAREGRNLEATGFASRQVWKSDRTQSAGNSFSQVAPLKKHAVTTLLCI
jgi:hypothetical protein